MDPEGPRALSPAPLPGGGEDLGTTATLVSHGVYIGLPLDIVDMPSPRGGRFYL